ncbi:hypothetical protein DPMN_024189 [Dreissena polymorpha]|uniref:Uncharacterized protein n=1 Tax=Dreissena polymorpha TaxID=45954 RepID=A0A9D4LM62_DREPO|nr:hypothetical protein DPMN_024189 [Dreissena polymorpha]
MVYEPLLLFAKRYAQPTDKHAQNANAYTTLHQCADSPQRDNLLNMKVSSLIHCSQPPITIRATMTTFSSLTTTYDDLSGKWTRRVG